MDKQKEIEGMADLIGHNKYVRTNEQVACILFDEGYRKAEEVRKETAKWFIDFLYKYRLNDTISKQDILNLAEKFGIEVDE